MDRSEALLREVEPFATLAPVIAWALRQSPPAEFVQVVVQDEYTHDVVVRVADGLFVVFDTT
jgi:hypothetical protein